MLFTALPLVLLSTFNLLVERTHATMLYSTVAISIIQFIRGILLGNDFYSTFMATILTSFLVPAVFLGLILLGAPLLYSQLETLLLASLLSTLTIQPLLIFYSLDADLWLQIVSAKLRNGIVYGSIGASIGAWIGAVPITLDWDRPWQKYPITIVLGSYVGCAVGTVLGNVFKQTAKKKKAKKSS